MPKHIDDSGIKFIPYKYKKHDLHRRIFKREIIISCVLGNGELITDKPKNIADPYLEILEPNKDYALFKYNIFKKINWSTNVTLDEYMMGFKIHCPYNKQFRKYYKWIYKGKERIKTVEKVLQYMTTEYFPAIITMDCGVLNDEHELGIDINIGNLETQAMVECWFKDIFNIQCLVKEDKITFNKQNTVELLDLIKPIVKKVPSKFECFYKN